MSRMLLPVAALTTTVVVLSGALVTPADAAKPSKTTTSATWSAQSAVIGSVVTVTGTVKDRVNGARRVVLQQKTASGWRKVDRGRTTSAGAYGFTVPTDWYYSSRMRVLTTRTRKARADTTRATKLTVSPAYAPLGKSGAWRYTSRPANRVDPCQTVTYKVNAAQGLPDPATAVAASQSAIASITQATGVRFRYTGTTSTIPGGKGRWPGRTDLVIAWAKPTQTRWQIGGSVAARGGPVKNVWGRDARGRRIGKSLRSAVVLDSTQPNMDATSTPQLLQHELGHVMGLGHVKDVYQYMNATATLYDLPPFQWGAGDLAGFRKVGLEAGCVR